MKKGTKLAAVALSAAMVFGLSSCGGTPTTSPEVSGTPSQTGTPETVYHIGIIQQLEHQALDAATEGFQDALVELLGEDGVVFDYKNAQDDKNNCVTISTKFVADGVDLIMANATTALQTAAAATGDIPIIGTSITDYLSAGVVESNEAPGRNVTGVSDLAPIDQQIDLLVELFPEAETVGILYCSSEPNSVFQADLAQAALEAKNIEVKIFTVADTNEIQSVTSSAVDAVDVLYTPTDNTIAGAMELVKNVTLPAGLPVVCGEENMAAIGGVATLSISYYDLGYQAGLMAYEILVNGANPAEMSIQYVPDTTKKYNPELAEALNVTIPEGIEAMS